MAITKPGPVAILDDAQNADLFFDTLERVKGNVSAACRALGISWDHVRRARINSPQFAQRFETVKADVRKLRAELILEQVDDQILKSLQMNMVPLTDEDGQSVLDDDFEQVMVPGSLITVKGLVDIRKDARQSVEGEGPLVALQVNSNKDGGDAPTFVMADTRDVEELMRLYGAAEDADDETIDAEFEEVQHDTD